MVFRTGTHFSLHIYSNRHDVAGGVRPSDDARDGARGGARDDIRGGSFPFRKSPSPTDELAAHCGFVEQLPVFIRISDRDGNITYLNKTAREWKGLAASGPLSGLAVSGSDRILIEQAALHGVWEGEASAAGGRQVWQIVTAHGGVDGNVEFYSTLAIERAGQTQLDRVRLHLHSIIEDTTEFVAAADVQGNIIYLNRAARRMLGFESESGTKVAPGAGGSVLESRVRGSAPESGSDGEVAPDAAEPREPHIHAESDAAEPREPHIHAESDAAGLRVPDIHPEWAMNRLRSEGFPTAVRQGQWEGETAILTREGREIPVWQALVAHKDSTGTVQHYSTIIRDISEHKEREQELHYQASYDSLTGAMNRSHFEEYLGRELASARRGVVQGAVAHFDLDKFKEVNDTYGHHAGDEVLRHVARIVQGHLRGNDRLARLGGDEFAILLSGAKPQHAKGVGERLLKLLRRQTVVVDGREIRIRASMGIAMYPEHGATVEEVLIRADRAMYESKRWGGNRVAVYSPALETRQLPKQGEAPKQGAHWLWPV